MLKKVTFATITIIILLYGIVSVNIGNQKLQLVKDKITFKTKQKIKKYIFHTNILKILRHIGVVKLDRNFTTWDLFIIMILLLKIAYKILN